MIIRPHNQGKWRSSNRDGYISKFSTNATNGRGRGLLLNAPPEFIHKGAAVGWGLGRGNPQKIDDEILNERMSSFSPFQKQHKDGGRGQGRFQHNSNTSLPSQWSDPKEKSRW